MSNISVSVILPVYNVERYLRECLDTLVSQTLTNIEIIAIDDASSDQSYAILLEYAAKDSRIVALKNPYNIGAARTRNIGIQLARGKYISILDSDDFFELHFLEVMLKKAEADHSDLVICNIYKYDNSTGERSFYSPPVFLLKKMQTPFSAVEIYKHIFSTFWMAPFNKLVLRSFLMNLQISFQDLPNSNDVFWGNIILIYAKKMSYIDNKLIYYRSAWGGNIGSRRTKEPLCAYYALKRIYDVIICNNRFLKYRISFNTMVMDIIYSTYVLLKNEEKREFGHFWAQQGLSNLGMRNLKENDFLSRMHFIQWKKLSFDGNIQEPIQRELYYDLYEKFFQELNQRNLNVAIWGFGKEGKEFIRAANLKGFSIIEVYDHDSTKWEEGELPVKSFLHRNPAVNAIVVTTVNFARELATEARHHKPDIHVFDFAAYLWKGAMFEECEIN